MREEEAVDPEAEEPPAAPEDPWATRDPWQPWGNWQGTEPYQIPVPEGAWHDHQEPVPVESVATSSATGTETGTSQGGWESVNASATGTVDGDGGARTGEAVATESEPPSPAGPTAHLGPAGAPAPMPIRVPMIPQMPRFNYQGRTPGTGNPPAVGLAHTNLRNMFEQTADARARERTEIGSRPVAPVPMGPAPAAENNYRGAAAPNTGAAQTLFGLRNPPQTQEQERRNTARTNARESFGRLMAARDQITGPVETRNIFGIGLGQPQIALFGDSTFAPTEPAVHESTQHLAIIQAFRREVLGSRWQHRMNQSAMPAVHMDVDTEFDEPRLGGARTSETVPALFGDTAAAAELGLGLRNLPPTVPVIWDGD